MRTDKTLPTTVKIIGWMFILLGASYALEMLIAPFQDRFVLSSGILIAFFGRGLLRGSNAWRRAALWLSLISALVCIGAGAFLLELGKPVKFNFFGVKMGYVSPFIAMMSCFTLSTIFAWAAFVLSSQHIKRAFLTHKI